MELLGSAADGNGAQIFVLTDSERARVFEGGTNGEGELALGSDWARGFEAFYGVPPDKAGDGEDTRAVAKVVELRGTPVDLVDFGSGGWALVFRVGDRFVLVDGAFADEKEVPSEAGDEENLPTAAVFEAYVTAPPSDAASQGHVIEARSGWLVAMSSTERFAELNGDEPPTLEDLETVDGGAVQLDDASGGHALFFKVPAPRYRVFVEPEIEAEWGSAARVVLVPA